MWRAHRSCHGWYRDGEHCVEHEREQQQALDLNPNTKWYAGDGNATGWLLPTGSCRARTMAQPGPPWIKGRRRCSRAGIKRKFTRARIRRRTAGIASWSPSPAAGPSYSSQSWFSTAWPTESLYPARQPRHVCCYAPRMKTNFYGRAAGLACLVLALGVLGAACVSSCVCRPS